MDFAAIEPAGKSTVDDPAVTAVERWAAELAEWAIPPEILARAEESPWGVPPNVFVRRADSQLGAPSTPTHRAVLDYGGTVLDIGAGAGAASLPCARAITHVTAVDPNARLLAEFAERAAGLSVPHRTIEGRWPDVADQVGVVDVIVCANVLYNVPDLPPFVEALARHARRVVLELTDTHPLAEMNDLWKRFHNLDRPHGPTADDAVVALRELGVEPEEVRWQKAPAPVPFDELVAVTRRRLCLARDRTADVAAALAGDRAGTRRMVTLVWSPDRMPESSTMPLVGR
ncbi:class I SAM-dependent methyltransferase [Amycolatopsis alkalitolerans]|uniref:Class I SAM-dependent methyltransferase n=1 Tax=Amycolatopsis alkalitolerans TaxID=2547244 RepID=A0A5C4M6K9_9PSEU|nr:class I SAM-dependent methyltransferase [Amycolatopsis alkalitolerans]TNC28070.1 class I SAM-dependent methyltransferase [Amycolatopsis alkalitolerans]